MLNKSTGGTYSYCYVRGHRKWLSRKKCSGLTHGHGQTKVVNHFHVNLTVKVRLMSTDMSQKSYPDNQSLSPWTSYKFVRYNFARVQWTKSNTATSINPYHFHTWRMWPLRCHPLDTGTQTAEQYSNTPSTESHLGCWFARNKTIDYIFGKRNA